MTIDPKLAALLEAEAIIAAARKKIDTTSILWDKAYNAGRHIQKQIDAYFRPEAA
jgi:hypothetical protein